MNHLSNNIIFSLVILSNVIKNISKTANFKATMNALIIPISLSLLTETLLSGIVWILFVCYIYKFQKVNTENGKVFFEYISFISTVSLVLVFIIALIFITELI